jgi:hypothetical protein
MSLPAFLQRIIDWIREGYPEGLPEHDYIALFALLGRRLSQSEQEQVCDNLVECGHPPAAVAERRELMRKAISAASNAPAAEADVARVEARLRAVGWNLDGADPPL